MTDESLTPTPVSPTTEAADQPQMLTPGGEDTLHCSFYCKFSDAFKKRIQEIREAKQLAQNPVTDAAPDADVPIPIIECDGNVYVVMRDGFATVKTSPYGYFPYVLKDGGITVAIQPIECRDASDASIKEAEAEEDFEELFPATDYADHYDLTGEWIPYPPVEGKPAPPGPMSASRSALCRCWLPGRPMSSCHKSRNGCKPWAWSFSRTASPASIPA